MSILMLCFAGREEIYVTKWFAFPRMAFLLDKDKPRNTIDSYRTDDSVQVCK